MDGWSYDTIAGYTTGMFPGGSSGKFASRKREETLGKLKKIVSGSEYDSFRNEFAYLPK
jgi:hypothetical protein